MTPRQLLGLVPVTILVLGAAAPAAAADPTPNSIYGRVIMRGRNVPGGRVVRVEVSPSFPLFATPPLKSATVSKKGEYEIGKLADGFYWVVAYIDDDKDGRRGPGEIRAFPRLAPVFAGPDHRHVRVPIELDPVHAIVATRFRKGSGTNDRARVELTFVALYARNPATGAPLPDAEVTLEEDGKARPMTWDPSFPGGAFVVWGDERRAGDRYVFVVSHPALGKAKRRLVLHARSLGSVPVIEPALPAAPPAGQDLRVTWHQPAWSNFATVEVHEVGGAGGPRRIWPAGLDQAVSAEGAAVVPGALLTPGRRLRIDVVVGRADVRAENGQIWATASAEREVTVGPPQPPGARPAAPRGATGATGTSGATGATGRPPRPAPAPGSRP